MVTRYHPGMRTPHTALALMFPALICGFRVSDPPRPNLVFLLSDDLAWDAADSVGRPRLELPSLDRLAREGARFRNAFVTTSVCCPARLSFLTGRYVRNHGLLSNSMAGGRVRTFANQLRKAGYDTGYFGKWHLRVAGNRQPGFATTAVYEGQGKYDDCPFLVDGRPTRTSGWVDDVATDFALEWLRREREEPFLLCLGFKSPHGPYRPADRHAGLFEGAPIEPPPNADARPPFPRRSEHEELARARREHTNALVVEDAWADELDRSEFDRWNEERVRQYLRHVVAVDENTGRVLDALDELGLAENTLVVFASDNGFALGQHGVFGKRNAYEESMRITLLARWPARFAGDRTVDELALNVDLAPTFLAAAGETVPDAMDGASWLPLLEADRADDLEWRDHFLYEYFWEPDSRPNVTTIYALRTRRHKLVTYLQHPGWTELYDLEADPLERTNLASKPGSAELRAELEGRLAGAERRVGERPRMGR